jgi:universal stress protein A
MAAAGWTKILLPIKFAKRLPAAEMQLARDLARIHKAKITLLHVVPLSAAVTADAGLAAQYYLEAEEDAKLKLGTMAQTRLKGFDVDILVESGDPARTIVKEAARLRSDLVIIATHNRGGIKRFLLGSVAEQVVRRCPCALLTIRPGG